jgi:ankyrin repeat protein
MWQVLLQHGADPDSRNSTSRTPLAAAVSADALHLAQLLHVNGADVSSLKKLSKGEAPAQLGGQDLQQALVKPSQEVRSKQRATPQIHCITSL